ncbi:MAG: hypothetical protein JW829_06145 [Pirellulales bacterium]|nr:hypothetical protein [Pirellulales bacterium]
MNANNRAGSILAVVLACLLVASMVGLALIRTVWIHHRQVRVMGLQRQCFWLLEAGIQRAGRKLAGVSEYQGEKWEIAADVLGTHAPAVVTIEVKQVDHSPDKRMVRVEARFANETMQDIVCQRELILALPPTNVATNESNDKDPENKDTTREPNGDQ